MTTLQRRYFYPHFSATESETHRSYGTALKTQTPNSVANICSWMLLVQKPLSVHTLQVSWAVGFRYSHSTSHQLQSALRIVTSLNYFPLQNKHSNQNVLSDCCEV